MSIEQFLDSGIVGGDEINERIIRICEHLYIKSESNFLEGLYCGTNGLLSANQSCLYKSKKH